jgi:hypothetical protein
VFLRRNSHESYHFFPALALGVLVLGAIALVLFAPREITVVSTSRVKALNADNLAIQCDIK